MSFPCQTGSLFCFYPEYRTVRLATESSYRKTTQRCILFSIPFCTNFGHQIDTRIHISEAATQIRRELPSQRQHPNQELKKLVKCTAAGILLRPLGSGTGANEGGWLCSLMESSKKVMWTHPRVGLHPNHRNMDTQYLYLLMRHTMAYPKVSGLAARSENCRWYRSLPLGTVLSLFCGSV